MVYPIKRYTDIQGWIPETDVDGVDIKDTFVSDCENIDFENAFMKNAIAPVEVAHPTLVIEQLGYGYEILGLQYFNHETRGDTFFYVLYKYMEIPSPVHLLRFFVKDDTSTYELNIDEQNSGVTFTGKPTDVIFALADNQLKISLNINVIYNTLSKTVVGNFTLAYLEKKSYLDGVADREEGWYLFPRWLGWSHGELPGVTAKEDSLLTFETAFDTGALNSEIVEAVDISGGPTSYCERSTAEHYEGSYSVRLRTAAPLGEVPILRIRNIQEIKAIKFFFKFNISTSGYNAQFLVETRVNGVFKKLDGFQSNDFGSGWNEYIIDFGEFLTPNVQIDISVQGEGVSNASIFIDNVTLYYNFIGSLILGVKNFDGQRSLIQTLDDPFKVNSTSKISIPKADIDWRVVAYEVYTILDGGTIYSLVSTFEVDGAWIEQGVNIEKDLIIKDFDYESTTTLIFNYGLGATVQVYTIDEDTGLIGKDIFSEAYHKARTYYVKGDMRVYQSHLSGTGRGQPDSFPFSIENQYGFFETFKSEKNYTVAVTPQDELVIGTRRKTYVYFIQGGRGVILRTLKAINGGQSVIGSKAMLSDLEGQPEATVLAWFNEEGLYLSPGGRREPKDIIKATHKNYWLARANKDKAVLFFNKAKKEIWIAFPNKEVMIYELDFNKWKKYKYNFVITSFIGNVDNDLYVLGDNEKMYKIDFNSGSTLTGFIITHYSSNTLTVDRYPIPAPEHELKVLQELFVAWNQRSSGVFEYIIIADGNTYLPINMFPNNFTDLVLAPQLLVYGKIKIKLKIPAVGAWVRELGYTYSVPDRAPGQITQPNKTGIGMNTGLQLGVHQ